LTITCVNAIIDLVKFVLLKTKSERRFVMKYIAPEMEITLLETADIILVSGDPEDGKGDNATGDDEL
jgi:hypothetical protein